MAEHHIAIVGPTASGKTAVAVSIARVLGDAELVSVDAMAVYRRLDVGTAKPKEEQRTDLDWHLIDVVEPSEEFSVAQFQQLAHAALAGIDDRRQRAVLVGGTGLYHRAVIDRLDIPPRFPHLASELERHAKAPAGLAELFRELELRDPVAASRMHAMNERRIIRALEVCRGSGRPFSSFGPGLREYEPNGFLMVGLALSQEDLERRIGQRLETQFAEGFVDEVRGLMDDGIELSRTASQALGYRELLSHLRYEMDLSQAKAEIRRRTRLFARRQMAWFRRDPRIVWIDALDHPEERVLGMISRGSNNG